MADAMWSLHGFYVKCFFLLFATRNTYGSRGMCINEKQAVAMGTYDIFNRLFLFFNAGQLKECTDPGFLAWKRRKDGH